MSSGTGLNCGVGEDAGDSQNDDEKGTEEKCSCSCSDSCFIRGGGSGVPGGKIVGCDDGDGGSGGSELKQTTMQSKISSSDSDSSFTIPAICFSSSPDSLPKVDH